MVRTSSLLSTGIQVDFESLFKVKDEPNKKYPKKQKQPKERTQQENLKGQKEKKKGKMRGRDEEAVREREKREMERKRESERLEKIRSREMKGDVDGGTQDSNFPLRQAVILSEVIGEPRCKSRHRRGR